MITLNEFLRGANYDVLDQKIKDNIKILLERVNKIRDIWGRAMIVTSGLRTMEDHLRIYAQKGITDLKKIPMKSSHLNGCAIDIADSHLELTAFLKKDGSKILVDNELWCEDGNKNWVHLQINPPASGNRWFKP